MLLKMIHMIALLLLDVIQSCYDSGIATTSPFYSPILPTQFVLSALITVIGGLHGGGVSECSLIWCGVLSQEVGRETEYTYFEDGYGARKEQVPPSASPTAYYSCLTVCELVGRQQWLQQERKEGRFSGLEDGHRDRLGIEGTYGIQEGMMEWTRIWMGSIEC
jgi:hypothetical protein